MSYTYPDKDYGVTWAEGQTQSGWNEMKLRYVFSHYS